MIRRLKRYLDWRAVLVYTHRWLGIAGCVLFVAWFFSGIVMMYARMPALADEERLARAAALDLSTRYVSPAEAAEAAARVATRCRSRCSATGRSIGSAAAGDAERRHACSPTPASRSRASIGQQAEAIARRLEPGYTGPLRYDGYLTEPDQWTLQARAAMPLHRFALDDAGGHAAVRVGGAGEVVLRTTRRERFWGYLGPVIHWVYFTPLRRNGPLWSEFVIWSSLVGCVMCVTGMVWGLMRFSPSARFRLSACPSRSPYTGWMKWHHYAGLSSVWSPSRGPTAACCRWARSTGSTGRRTRPPGAQRRERHGRAAATSRSRAPRRARGALTVVRPEVARGRCVQGQRYWTAERPPRVSEARSAGGARA